MCEVNEKQVKKSYIQSKAEKKCILLNLWFKKKKKSCNKNMQGLMNSTSQMTGSVVSTLKGVIKKFGERGGSK